MNVLKDSELQDERQEIIEKLSSFFKILSEPTRLKIIMYILEKPKCIVNDIVNALEIAQPIVSHHLHVMENFNLIIMKREGRIKKCCIKDPEKIRQILRISKNIVNRD